MMKNLWGWSDEHLHHRYVEEIETVWQKREERGGREREGERGGGRLPESSYSRLAENLKLLLKCCPCSHLPACLPVRGSIHV